MENQFGHFNLGPNTLDIPMTLHQETRQKLVDGLKNNGVKDAVAVFQGGKTLMQNDTDVEILFRQESYFNYLFGVKEPDCFAAIDVDTGKSILFVPRLPASYAIWMGKIQPPTYYKDMYAVDECYYNDEISTVLANLGNKTLLVLHGVNTDSGCPHHGATFEGIEKFTVDKEKLFPVLQECRVIKTKKEIEVMRYVVKATCEGHRHVMKSVKPGYMEYQMESIFKDHCYRNAGCRYVAYQCICGTGMNSAILHYGHGSNPNAKMINDGDICMFDMGAEYHCYCGDVSRSFPANGKFTENQKKIFNSVLAAHDAVMASLKEGVRWTDMHLLAHRVICENLLKHGLLQGDIDEIMEAHVAYIFMPHGLGHFLGIDVHDVGGYPVPTARHSDRHLKCLRTNRILLENMIITVEPGIYFIPSLIEPALEDPAFKKFLVVDKIKEFMTFGGVRIEDDVLILKNGCENLSASLASTVEEIEHIMAEGKEKK